MQYYGLQKQALHGETCRNNLDPGKLLIIGARNWAERGVWKAIFQATCMHKETLAGILDSTIVRAHQDAAGGQGGPKKMT